MLFTSSRKERSILAISSAGGDCLCGLGGCCVSRWGDVGRDLTLVLIVADGWVVSWRCLGISVSCCFSRGSMSIFFLVLIFNFSGVVQLKSLNFFLVGNKFLLMFSEGGEGVRGCRFRFCANDALDVKVISGLDSLLGVDSSGPSVV